jgi:Fe-S oxidoreductase/nitrate reductase gamma subunit
MAGTGREILWGVPRWAEAAMYALFAIVLAVAGRELLRRFRRWRSGRDEREDRLDGLPRRIASLLKLGFLQSRVVERFPAGLFHAWIFSGFLVLTVATTLVAVHHDLGIRILDGRFYLAFKLFADGFGLLLLAGCAGTLAKRLASPSPGWPSGAREAAPAALLLLVGLTGFLVETLRIAATRPSAAWASFASDAASRAFSGAGLAALVSAHAAAWWVHLFLAFLFLATVPYGKLFHVLAGPASIFLRSSRPSGALQDDPGIEEEERPGVLAVTDFSWKQLLSADACTRCGRCHEECPARAAGMPLSPRDVVLGTAAASAAGLSGDGFSREVLTAEAIWSCTTCGACVRACPVSIEQLDMIVDVRRGFVSEGKIPDGARLALRKIGDSGNPWGLPQADRASWSEGLDVPLASEKGSFEWLYWVGCASSYDLRSRKVARAIAALLSRAGVDFAILGPEESCCGEAARRLGEEGLFRLGTVELVKETFERYGVRKVVTGCPHCFNAFRNEYPRLGVEVEAVHHTGFLSSLLRSGRLLPGRPHPVSVALHDACYLGRHNGIYDAPREILAAVPGTRILEPSRTRERAFCCGGGGGGMWMELGPARINRLRFDQLKETGAGSIGTSCPWCLAMLEDAGRSRDDSALPVRDVAEALLEAAGKPGEGDGGR